MRVLKWMSSLVLALACGAALPSAQTPAGGRGAPNSLFLAPKAESPAGWVAPNSRGPNCPNCWRSMHMKTIADIKGVVSG